MQTPTAERPPGLPRVFADIGDELRRRPSLPPGETNFSPLRTHRFQRDTLRTTLAYRERYGNVYTVRMFHRLTVVMLGPAANHFVTVTGADNFSWRRGMFGEQLIPLIGDGLITTDGEYHDRARRIMMPAFHAKRMDSAVAVMLDEAERALAPWRAGGDGRRLPLDPRPLDEHRDAGAAGPRPARGRPRPRGRRGVRARARVLRHRDLADAAARPRVALVRGCSGRGASSTGSSTPRSRAGEARARTATTSSRCCSRPATRTARASATASSATS